MPREKYQIFNPTDLDDLVLLWIAEGENESLKFADDREIRLRINNVIPDAICFSGPLNCQKRFDPLSNELVSFPVIYHIELNQTQNLKIFLWLERKTIQLHLPEILFTTGSPSEDTDNLSSIKKLSNDLSNALHCHWVLAEFNGENHQIRKIGEFWSIYIEDLFKRISYEELDN